MTLKFLSFDTVPRGGLFLVVYLNVHKNCSKLEVSKGLGLSGLKDQIIMLICSIFCFCCCPADEPGVSCMVNTCFITKLLVVCKYGRSKDGHFRFGWTLMISQMDTEIWLSGISACLISNHSKVVNSSWN